MNARLSPMLEDRLTNDHGTPATTYGCVYCWPRFTQAEVWDAKDRPCCIACGANPNRKCTVPKFVLRALQ